MSIDKGIGNPPCAESGGVWDGGVDHKFGKEASRVPWPAFMAFSVVWKCSCRE